MNIKIQTKSFDLRRYFFDSLKIFWSKFVLKRKSFQPLPNEAPH